MKVFIGLLLGSLLVALVLAFLVAGSTSATSGLQACSVESDGSGDYTTIQDAVDDGTCDPINVGAGTFTETVTINRSVTIQGLGQAQTTVDGNANDSVFTIQAGAAVTLTGLTIQNGSAPDGGGIHNLGTLTVIASNFSDNSAYGAFPLGNGGGIFNSGTLNGTDNNFSNNSAPRGGGIYNSYGTLNLTSTTLSGNSAVNVGGGIRNEGGVLTVTASTLISNSAQNGGGIFNSNGTLNVSESTLISNTAPYGGGIYNHDTVNVTRSTLSGNSAGAVGGGIMNWGTLSVSESTLSDNSATGDGGAIRNDGTLTLTHSTLSGNRATWGGGIWSYGTLKMTNSIIANSPRGGDCYGAYTSSQGYNIDSDGSCNLTEPTDQPSTDPLLGPLQDNGGPTWTQALLVGSPAIDAGSCPGAAADQRGYRRPVDILTIANADHGCDIGAYEYEPLVISKSGPPAVELYGRVTYSLTVANNLTSTLSSVVITDSVPAGAVYLSGGTLVGNVVSWTVPSLAPSTTVTRHFVVSATTTLTNSDYQASAGSYVAVGYKPVVTQIQIPVVGLAATNNSPTALGQATTLTATITAGSNVTYDWDFGDSTYGSGQHVAHTYLSAGVYTAVVTASNAVSSVTANTVVTVAEPVAGLAATNDSPTALGQATMLTATVTAGSDVTYDWDFGDSTHGSGQHVVHTYLSAGVYTAVVTASNLVSSVTANTVVTVAHAIAGLAATSDSPTVLGQTTTLTATVTAGSDVTYDWDFDDGMSGSGQNVVHTYLSAGVYTAVVTASNAVSSVTANPVVTVAEPVAGLAATNDSPTALGQATMLTATVTAGSDVTYDWDFGDGAYGNGQHVARTYLNVGVYTAAVTASNSVSLVTATTSVVVEEAIAGLAAVDDSPTSIGQATTFSATVTAGTHVSYTWDFGDTYTATGPVVTHTYTALGTYTATVTATNSVGSATTTTVVTVETWKVHLPIVLRAPASIAATAPPDVKLDG